uniref:CHK kinase-like domain-containing protein n=1 Tax=Acrobeloides nanus TaxID=290746 RepID=A0A914DHK3_9BILA
MFDNLFFKLEKLLKTSNFVNYAVSECCNDLGLPPMLCHGDLWNNNILWHNYDDGSASNEILAFIDFTEVFIGNPMFDLAKLMIFGVDAEIRREVETTIFEHYFNEFLKNVGIHIANPFDGKLDQLKQAYGYCMVYMALELALWSVYFKEATITYETIPEVHEAKMEKLMLRARLALDDAVQFLEKHDRKWIIN